MSFQTPEVAGPSIRGSGTPPAPQKYGDPTHQAMSQGVTYIKPRTWDGTPTADAYALDEVARAALPLFVRMICIYNVKNIISFFNLKYIMIIVDGFRIGGLALLCV